MIFQPANYMLVDPEGFFAMEGGPMGPPFEVIQQVTPLGLTVRLQPPGGGPVSRLPQRKHETEMCFSLGLVETYNIPGREFARSGAGKL